MGMKRTATPGGAASAAPAARTTTMAAPMVHDAGQSNGQVVIRTPSYPQTLFMPSANVMMDSPLNVYGSDVVGVLRTAIGDDGADAMVKIRRAGGRTIA